MQRYSGLILFLFLFLPFVVPAQVRTKIEVLRTLSNNLAVMERASFNEAASLAKVKGWPLTMHDKLTGRFSLLVGVDKYNGLPIYLSTENNIISAATIGTNKLWSGGTSGLNLSGSDNSVSGKLAIWDGGNIRATHVEFSNAPNRILQKDAGSLNDHATHVAGTLIAAGINPLAKGMAYGLKQLIAYNFDNHMSEIANEAGSGLLISNHSYGQNAGWIYNSGQSRWEFYGEPDSNEDYKFGYYSSDAQLWDSIAYNAPYYLIVKSAGNSRNQNGPAVGQPYFRYNGQGQMAAAGNRPSGISSNDGYDIISTYGTSKNILTVGAIQPLTSGYNSPSDVILSDFSSWGPTDDGRIKPDVVANGVGVLSTDDDDNTAYATLSGTSMASPSVAGSLLLLQEYYARLHSGNFMRSATLKGLVIHTADEAGPAPGPDYKHGWGVVNMEKAAAVITSNNTDKRILENTLNNGETYTLNVVASGKGPLVVTICWTDPKGDVITTNRLNNTTPKLVHDLDLRVKEGATTHMPWRLSPGVPSAAATKGDNNLDNVEKIEIPNPVPGVTYTIEVSHKGTLARGQQAYSLIISGVGGGTYCTSAATDNSGSIIEQVTFAGINNTISGNNCSVYRNFTATTGVEGSIQSLGSYPISVKLNTCSGLPTAKMLKVYIDFNNDGDFDDAGEQVAASGVISDNGTYNGTINIPAGLVVGNSTIMRIVMQETSDINDINPCGNYSRGETHDYRLIIAAPSNDMAMIEIISPTDNSCANPEQLITVRLKNLGSVAQTDVPLKFRVLKGATEILNKDTIYPGTIAVNAEKTFTLPSTFLTEPGNSYTIEATVNVAGDQKASNNTITATITTAGAGAAPTGTAISCGGQVILTSNETEGSVFWYDQPVGGNLLGSGNNVSRPSIPSNIYYIGKNDYRAKVGPADKSTLGNGSYVSTGGNVSVIRFSNSVPVVIEKARLFVGDAGRVEIIVANIANFNPESSFTYTPLASTIIDVYKTRTNTSSNDPNDKGAIFELNLPVTQTGEHFLIIRMLDGATLFRNNGVTGNPYPFGNNLFSITGNHNYTAANPQLFQSFYFYLYDIQVKLAGTCPTNRAAITGTAPVAPVITQNGNVLTSNISTNIQWYRNGVAIPNAFSASYTATESGTYKAVIQNCPTAGSNEIVITITALIDLDAVQDGGVIVSPNPNNGNFELAFETRKTGNLSINIFNNLGQSIYQESRSNFTGLYQKDLKLAVQSGVYMLQIKHGNKIYSQKLIINR